MRLQQVGSRTLRGAWIETECLAYGKNQNQVAPYGVRGLKLFGQCQREVAEGRTLRGAWIETELQGQSGQILGVAPYGVRGLKLGIKRYEEDHHHVAPYGVRGLKLLYQK